MDLYSKKISSIMIFNSQQNSNPLAFLFISIFSVMRVDRLLLIMQKSESQPSGSPCKTYFDLVIKIGSKGKYQKTLVLLFVWSLFSGGVGQLGPTFFFIMQPYSCQAQGLLTDSCTKYVCSLPEISQSQFLDTTFDSYTIPVQYNRNQCQGGEVVNIIYGFIYFGFVVSVFIRAFIIDSFGRRPLMIFFNGIIAIGSIVSISSINIWITGVGLFLINCGIDGTMKMSFNYLTEYYDPEIRERYSIATQVFYTVGYLLICLSSYFLRDWRLTAGIFIVFPSIIGFIFCVCYLREIPRYLIKQGEEHTMKVLNEIAVINNGQMVTLEDIRNIHELKGEKDTQKRVNPLILCKYPSLRKISICYFIILFLILTLYYGSSILVDSFGVSPYYIGIVLATADFTVYIPAYKLINTLRRKKASLILSLAIAGAAIGLTFIADAEQECSFCFLQILKIILLLIFRFSTNFLYVLVLLYYNQLFPEKVRAAGSILQIFGGLSLVINPALLSFLQTHDINPMVYFALSAMISFCVYNFLPETHGKIKEEIQELQEIQDMKVLEQAEKERVSLLTNEQAMIQT